MMYRFRSAEHREQIVLLTAAQLVMAGSHSVEDVCRACGVSRIALAVEVERLCSKRADEATRPIKPVGMTNRMMRAKSYHICTEKVPSKP